MGHFRKYYNAYNENYYKENRMQSAYSFYGSRLHLILEDEIADAYNRRTKQFYDAQAQHELTHGTKWNPRTDPLLMPVDEEAQSAYDKVGSIINLLVEVNGGGLEIADEEMTSDYLVKL